MRQPLPHVRLAHIQPARLSTTHTPHRPCPIRASTLAPTAVRHVLVACCAAAAWSLAIVTVVYSAAAPHLAGAQARLCGNSGGRCLHGSWLDRAGACTRRAAGRWEERTQEAGWRAGVAGAEAGQQQGDHDAHAYIRACTRTALEASLSTSASAAQIGSSTGTHADLNSCCHARLKRALQRRETRAQHDRSGEHAPSEQWMSTRRPHAR